MKLAALLTIVLVSAAAASAQDAPSPAEVELRTAIDLLKTKHINRDAVDWPALEAHVFHGVTGAAGNAYPAIRSVIAALHEKHTFLIDADEWKADMARQRVGNTDPDPVPPPEFRMLDRHTAYIRVRQFFGDDKAIAAYIANFQTNMHALRRAGACRYMVDLRKNGGGNMWPMLSGLVPVLGNPPYGYFLTAGRPDFPWMPKDDLVHPNPPVAVLVDRWTASSGEFTAMAFEGRPHTRVFGEPTAGYVSVNTLAALPDGAHLALTTGTAQDRRHRDYRVAVVPDEQPPPGAPASRAARRWLTAQSCRP